MSVSIISFSLFKVSEIKKLHDLDDWIIWSRILKDHLSMIDLWDVLIDDDFMSDEKLQLIEHSIWKKHQQKLNDLFILIIDLSSFSIIEMNSDKSATELYNLLKAEYNTLILIQFSILYRKIFRCILINHKSLREYFDDVVRAKNKLRELDDLISEMTVISCFLDELNSSYNEWKNVYMIINARFVFVLITIKDKNDKISSFTDLIVEDIMKQLVDRKSRLFNDINFKKNNTNARTFEVKSSQFDKRERSSNCKKAFKERHQSEDKSFRKCFNCHSFTHTKEKCWFKFFDMIMNFFHKLYLIKKNRNKDRNENRRTVIEWERNHLKKRMIIKLTIKIAITISESNKNEQWYMNTIAVVHIIHDLILFMTELNSQFEWIETITNQKIQIRDVETINLEIMLNDENINVHLHDVHYCLEVNSNLLSLSVLKEKHHTFNAKNAILRVLNDDEDVVLVINKQRSVYVLHQFIEINQYDLSLSSIFSIKSKSTSIEVWHQRVDHVNEKDLFQLSLIVIDVKFSDESIKFSFCETCVLDKQHRIHNINSITHRSKISEKRLHSDLFEKNNTLSAVKRHKYEVVVIDDVTRIKFSLILKNKDDISSVVISVFNKMKNQIDRKIKFFRFDDERKFKDLTFELNARDIQWKKSVSYAQNQDDVFERSIRTILERVRTLMIHAHLFRKFWLEALIAVCYIINRLLIKSLREMISYEAWYEEKSDLSSLRVYDCDVYVIDY